MYAEIDQGHGLAVQVARLPGPGPLSKDIFDLKPTPLKELARGEFLLRSIYVSVDAGSRAMLDDRADYVMKLAPGHPMVSSGVVGEIIASRNAEWPIGTFVRLNSTMWHSHIVVDPDERTDVIAVDPAEGPISMHLGVLGMVGFTGYVGIRHVAAVKEGDTVVISAAAGAVGSAAGQFAQATGARVIGIAGGPEKCAFVTDELGFDACVDYRAGNLTTALRATCPSGIDVYFENVGGAVQRAVFPLLNTFARVPICGQIAQYSGEGEAPGPNLMVLVLKRITLSGFLSYDHLALFDDFRAEARLLMKEGKLRHHVSIVDGIENAHEAINSLVTGRNRGKQVIRIGYDPTAEG